MLLKVRGVEYDYNKYGQEIIDKPINFEIEHINRYEGNLNPGNESMVYRIRSKSGKKGVFMAGYSINSFNGVDKIFIDISIKDFSLNYCE